MNALNVLFFNHIHHISYHNGMKVRVAVCSLIYRKVTLSNYEIWICLKLVNLTNFIIFHILQSLRLSQTALGETSPGKVVNLLSNDVNRFEWATFFMNFLWTAPLVTFLVGCLMWNDVGWTGLIGIFIIFCVVPVLSKCMGKILIEKIFRI